MDRTHTSIGLLADPGLPRRIAEREAARLRVDLERDVDPSVDWRIDVSEQTLPLDEHGEIPLLARAGEFKQQGGWGILIYLTDLPRAIGDEPMVCELSTSSRAALVSLPALGPWRVGARTRKLLVPLVDGLNGTGERPSAARTRQAIGGGEPVRRDDIGPDDVTYMTRSGRWNSLRLLAGMVRGNRPGRLLGALAKCMAAAVASGAFGIFFATIWSMADSLSPLRLAVISVAAIALLTFWLIRSNDLWSRSGASVVPGRVLLDNVATLITVTLAVVLLYAVLYLVLLAGAVLIITTEYLASQLGHDVDFRDYLQLTWLAASLGTVAGALGSTFDSDHAIREATYSRREYQRRLLAERRDE
ncbi:MAG: hypothetical protein GX596_06145 [Propionibacterium sp.]|nr:hypothetical protein [Propionibacterium sp.]